MLRGLTGLLTAGLAPAITSVVGDLAPDNRRAQGIRFGLAFCEASGDRLVRWSGTDELVAIGPNGALAAFCLSLADTQAGAHHNRREGWIEWIGTHPAYRRRGLGRAILRAGLQQLRSFGADVALLGTGSWNVEARRLFTSERLQLLHRVLWFAWEEEQETLYKELGSK